MANVKLFSLVCLCCKFFWLLYHPVIFFSFSLHVSEDLFFFSNISQTLVCWLRQQVLTSYVNGFGHFTSYILHLGERTRSWYVLLLAYTSNYWFFIYYIILKVSYSLEFEFNVLSSWIHKTLVLVIKSFLQTSKIGHRSTFFKSITSCFHW